MTAAVSLLNAQCKLHQRFLFKLVLVFAALYGLMAIGLERMHIVLGRGWFDTAWGLAQGAILVVALTGVGRCLRELQTSQKRVVPEAHLHASVQSLFQYLLSTCLIGLGCLALISHLPLQAPEVASSPWILPAFVWLGAPLYLLAAMAWHQAWSGWIKAAFCLLAFAHVVLHKAVALTWGVHQGAWLVCGLWLSGAFGLLCVRRALLKTVAVSWWSGPPWWQWWRLWNQNWFNRAPLLNPGMSAIVPALSAQYWVRLVNHPDFPETLVSNYFWSSKVVFLTLWMLTLLRSERSHWRWQMLPGSGFRKGLGSEIAQCTARYMVMDLAIGVTFIVALRWFWEPYALSDVIRTVQLLAWPLLVDFTWSLACAVWLRSVHWRSVPDMAALIGLLWLFWLAFDPRFWGARSWLQDGLMFCTGWLMVLRANKNFETSNCSWLNKVSTSVWSTKIKRV
ncbi:MAG: hypothetical protein ACOYB1_15175 [Limnohabitans sp.]